MGDNLFAIPFSYSNTECMKDGTPLYSLMSLAKGSVEAWKLWFYSTSSLIRLEFGILAIIEGDVGLNRSTF